MSTTIGDAGATPPGASDATDDAASRAAADVVVSEASGPDAQSDAPLPDATIAPVVCTTPPDLSNTGSGAFRIAFTLATTTTNYVALLNQRTWCMPGAFWDLRYRASVGMIEFELDDSAGHDVMGMADAILNDGIPHEIAFSRDEGTVTIQVDDAVAGTTDGGQTLRLLAFGDLVPLKMGTDVCDFEDGTVPLDGTISQVCISR